MANDKIFCADFIHVNRQFDAIRRHWICAVPFCVIAKVETPKACRFAVTTVYLGLKCIQSLTKHIRIDNVVQLDRIVCVFIRFSSFCDSVHINGKTESDGSHFSKVTQLNAISKNRMMYRKWKYFIIAVTLVFVSLYIVQAPDKTEFPILYFVSVSIKQLNKWQHKTA